MVGAHRAQRVICTHVMLTLTPSLPFLAVPLCMCRHGSAAVMPCGCDCTHWRCWWLPLPSHLLLLLLPLFHFSVASLPGVCVGGEGRGCVFHTATPPASCHQRQAGGCLFVLVAEGEEGVTFTGSVCVAAPPPPPSPCCTVLFVGVSMAHAAHTQPHHHHICHGIMASLPLLPSL